MIMYSQQYNNNSGRPEDSTESWEGKNLTRVASSRRAMAPDPSPALLPMTQHALRISAMLLNINYS